MSLVSLQQGNVKKTKTLIKTVILTKKIFMFAKRLEEFQ